MLTHNLRIFLEVANRRSITETANARYISQPAVSKAIQSLEKELSLKLFHRDKKNGMIPTEAGKKSSFWHGKWRTWRTASARRLFGKTISSAANFALLPSP